MSDWSVTLITTAPRSEEHTSELQSHSELVCRLLLEKKNGNQAVRPDLIGGHRRGADAEDGVETGLLVDRDRQVDVGKGSGRSGQTAVEVLHRAVAHMQVEHQLLLQGELAANLVRAGPGDEGVRAIE